MPPTCQHSEPAETPPSTTPASHTSRKISSRPCTRQTASRLATLPPPTQTTSCASRCARMSGDRGHREQAQVADLHATAGEGAVDPGQPDRVVAGGRAEVAEARALGRSGQLDHEVEDRRRASSRRDLDRGWRSCPCWWRRSWVRTRASGGSSGGRVGRAQGAQDRARRPGAAGHGALDGRGVAVVAAHVDAVAEVDRTPQLAAAAGRRAGRRRRSPWSGARGRRVATSCARAISSRTSGSAVAVRDELATRARPSGLYARLGVGQHDAVDQPPAGLPEHDQRLRPRRLGQDVDVRRDLTRSRRLDPGQQSCRRRGVGGDDDRVGPAAAVCPSARSRERRTGPGCAGGPARPRPGPASCSPTACIPAAGSPIRPRTKLRHKQVEVAARRRQLGLEQDAREERAEEAFQARRRRGPPTPQRLLCGALGPAQQPVDRCVSRPGPRTRRALPSPGRTRSVRVTMPGAADGRDAAGRRRDGHVRRPGRSRRGRTSRGRGRQVEVGGAGIAGVEHLEAPVDDETVDALSGQPSSGVVGCFEDVDVAAGRRQADGRRQAGEPGADDDEPRRARGQPWADGSQPTPAAVGRDHDRWTGRRPVDNRRGAPPDRPTVPGHVRSRSGRRRRPARRPRLHPRDAARPRRFRRGVARRPPTRRCRRSRSRCSSPATRSGRPARRRCSASWTIRTWSG